MGDGRFKPGQAPANKLLIPDRCTLEYLYCNWRLTTRQVAEHFEVCAQTVSKWLRYHDIDMRPSGTGLAQRGIEPPTGSELEHMVHVEHLSYREIANRYDVDQSAIPHWLDKHGIARSTTWYDRHNNPESLAEFQILYEDGLSLDQVAALFDVTRIQLVKLFKDNDIPIRDNGWQGGRRFTALDGQLVRSSYEQRVANWLYEQKVAYVYEPTLPFPGLADFLANGWYIEVWGVINSETYKARKIEKQTQYKVHALPLIELPVHSFDHQHNDLWRRRLSKCLLPT